MNVTTVKTTTTVRSINWRATIQDDNGSNVATMTGAVDSARPLGTTSLNVSSQALYAANADDVKAAYAEFQAMVLESAAFTTSETEEE
ncbi:MAG: hypothetical protein LUC89_05820 [Oscillospiraceae bacterium]|nr:hypothetical protein [Oscillospiraceae bacterium]